MKRFSAIIVTAIAVLLVVASCAPNVQKTDAPSVETVANEIVGSIIESTNGKISGTYSESGETAAFTCKVTVIGPDFGDGLTCVAADVVVEFYGPAAVEETEGSGEAVFTPETFKLTTSGIGINAITGYYYATLDVQGTAEGVTISGIDTGNTNQSSLDIAGGTLTAIEINGEVVEKDLGIDF